MENKRLILKIILLLYVFSIIALNRNPNIYWISNIVGYILFLTYVFECIIYKNNLFYGIAWPHIIFFIFIVYVSIGVILGVDALPLLKTLFQLLLFSIILCSIISIGGQLWPVYYGVILGLYYSIYISWSQVYGMINTGVYRRVGSTLENPNTFAFSLMLGVMLSILNIVNCENAKNNKFIKCFHVLNVIIFSSFILFFSGSRKGTFLLIFLPLLYVMLSFSKKVSSYSKIKTFFGVLLFVPLLGFLIKNSPFFSRFQKLINFVIGDSVGDDSVRARFYMVNEALKLWNEKPFFGWGLGQFRYVSNIGKYSHNNYVELLANNGILGFLLYYMIYVIIVFYCFKLIKSYDLHNNKVGKTCLFFVFINLFWDFASVTYYDKITWIILSLLIGLITVKNDKQKIDFEKIRNTNL